jgi:DNA-directed RNA polymerase subunit E'/Rpb7
MLPEKKCKQLTNRFKRSKMTSNVNFQVDQKLIERKIYLEPKYLNRDVLQTLKTKAFEKLVGTCDETNGYITNAEPDIKLLNNRISRTDAGVYFEVQIKIDCIKPEIGKIYPATICMIYCGGILLKLFNTIEVLVPCSRLIDDEEYELDEDTTFFFFKKGNRNEFFTVGQVIPIQIEQCMFSKGVFKCIARVAASS